MPVRLEHLPGQSALGNPLDAGVPTGRTGQRLLVAIGQDKLKCFSGSVLLDASTSHEIHSPR